MLPTQDDTIALVGLSRSLESLRGEVEYASRCDAKVLITGESGVGKEVVARLIHASSKRNRIPLVTVNCAALTETLLETELFGHVRGSFTGAIRDRTGVLEQANRGTVFMDEIGETTPRMQGLLLRFMETGEIQRVGSDRTDGRVDVRVIAATNRDLLTSVQDKTFREDLYYRLNVIHLHVPPLRERMDDMLPLLNRFLQQFARTYRLQTPEVSPDVLELLYAYTWPGNVRELKNLAERLVVRGGTGTIEPAGSSRGNHAAADPDAGRPGRGRQSRGRIVRSHGGAARVVLDRRLSGLHGPRSHPRRSPRHRQERVGAGVRESRRPDGPLQHAARGLQTVLEHVEET